MDGMTPIGAPARALVQRALDFYIGTGRADDEVVRECREFVRAGEASIAMLELVGAAAQDKIPFPQDLLTAIAEHWADDEEITDWIGDVPTLTRERSAA